MSHTPHRIKVGQYDLGSRRVNVFGEPDSESGSFNTAPSSGITEILVGFSARSQGDLIVVLLHEAEELVLHDLRLRFQHDVDEAMGSDRFIFILDHSQFSEVCGRVGLFMNECQRDVCLAYRKFNKKRRTK
jgi:hypothetical protein